MTKARSYKFLDIILVTAGASVVSNSMVHNWFSYIGSLNLYSSAGREGNDLCAGCGFGKCFGESSGAAAVLHKEAEVAGDGEFGVAHFGKLGSFFFVEVAVGTVDGRQEDIGLGLDDRLHHFEVEAGIADEVDGPAIELDEESDGVRGIITMVGVDDIDGDFVELEGLPGRDFRPGDTLAVEEFRAAGGREDGSALVSG